MIENQISNNEIHDTLDTADARKPADWLPTWDGPLYAANTLHHRLMDGWFLQHFPLKDMDRVLDVGCGSGDFTAVVAEMLPHGQLIGAEPQASLLVEARAVMRPNQQFEQVRAQDLGDVFGEQSFDAAFSRAVFQWIPSQDYPGIFATIRRLLKPGGWFRLECGGAGNIKAILPFLAGVSARHGGPPPPWTFLDPGTVMELLEAAGFTLSAGDHPGGMPGYVHSVAQRRGFTRDSLIGWMRSQCYQGFEIDMPVENHSSFRAEVEDRIDELRRADGTYDLTYVRIDALVYRPGATRSGCR